MTDLANRVGCTVTGTPGTGTITLSTAVSGYQDPSTAYGANATVNIVIEDGTAWEVAIGCNYDHSLGTLTRGTLEDSSTGSVLALTSAAKVFVTTTASELADFLAHLAITSGNPHGTSAGDVGADPSGTAAGLISSHEGAADPHSGYALESALGGAAVLNVGTTTGTVAAGDDARLSDARTPTAHKTTHATGGSDALTAGDVGADPAGTTSTHASLASTHAGLVADQVHGATDKTTPVDADELPLADSAASYALKKLTWANVKSVLSSTFAGIGNWVEEAANTVARRNGANAQTIRNYTTYTDASNYERLTLTGTAGSNVEINAGTAGTGGANLNVKLSPAGTGAVLVTPSTNSTSCFAVTQADGSKILDVDATNAWTYFRGVGALSGQFLRVRNYSGMVQFNANTTFLEFSGASFVQFVGACTFSSDALFGGNVIKLPVGTGAWIVALANDTTNQVIKMGAVVSGVTPSAALYSSNTERVRIAADGNIGIGTTTPTISDGTGLHLAGKILRIATAKTPASASDTGNAGDICWDANYLYTCVATNTWKRSALSTW